MLRPTPLLLQRQFSLFGRSAPDVPPVTRPDGTAAWDHAIANASLSSSGEPPSAGMWHSFSHFVTDSMQQGLFEPMHDVLGMPWWLAIAGGALCMRLVTFPLKIKTTRNTRLLTLTNHEFATRVAPLLQRRVNFDEKLYRQEAQVELAKMLRERGVKLSRFFLPVLVNAPLFLAFTATLRRMSEAKLMGPEHFLSIFSSPAVSESLLNTVCMSWPDPYVTAGMVLINAVVLEVTRRSAQSETALALQSSPASASSPTATVSMPSKPPPARSMRMLFALGHVFNLASFWFLSGMPSSIAMFIGASNVCHCVESFLLRARFMQRFLKV